MIDLAAGEEIPDGILAALSDEALSMLYDSVPNVLSELIRTAFVAGKRNKFCVADFSAIEARVLSWLTLL